MQSTLNYAQAFEKKHDVRFVGVRLVEILKNVVSSNNLAANFTTAWEFYITVSRWWSDLK